MPYFIFSPLAKKTFSKLDNVVQERIRQKLIRLKDHENIDAVLKPLAELNPPVLSLRVGDYRLILERMSKTEFQVLKIGHRKHVYRLME